jgi:hypothetical protein
MSNVLLQMLQPYFSTAGMINAGEIVGFPSALAATLVANSVAVEVDEGDGAGVVLANPQRGILASETPAQYAAAGFTLGDQAVSAAIQGFLGGDNVTIIDGHAQPVAEPWA